MHVNQRWKLDPAEVFVLRVAHLVVHVAVDRIGKPRVDQLHEILVVDRAVHLVLAENGEGDDRHLSAILREAEVRLADDLQRDGRRAGCDKRGLEESVRRQRQLELPEVAERHAIEIRTRERRRPIALDVPGVGAAQDRRDLFLRHRRLAEQRVVALPPRVVFTRPAGVVVDEARVVGHLVFRPVLSEAVGLADLRGPAGAGDLQRLQVGAAHRLDRGLQDGPRILRGRGRRRRQPQQRRHHRNLSNHTALLQTDPRHGRCRNTAQSATGRRRFKAVWPCVKVCLGSRTMASVLTYGSVALAAAALLTFSVISGTPTEARASRPAQPAPGAAAPGRQCGRAS